MPGSDMPGIDGFLGTRASIMLDVVSVAMFLVLPALGFSIWQVRYRRRYRLHKALQLCLGAVLLVAVAGFEVDMQLISGWRERAMPSPYWSDSGFNAVLAALYVHLVFAVSTAGLWVFVIAQALRKIPSPPAPSSYSRRHIFWARLAAIDLALTAATGWVFYGLAFVAN
jgi:putative membrane protein